MKTFDVSLLDGYRVSFGWEPSIVWILHLHLASSSHIKKRDPKKIFKNCGNHGKKVSSRFIVAHSTNFLYNFEITTIMTMHNF